MKSTSINGSMPFSYIVPALRVADLRSRNICIAASKGSYINDAGEEDDDIFGE